jgi:hypothetical protein
MLHRPLEIQRIDAATRTTRMLNCSRGRGPNIIEC